MTAGDERLGPGSTKEAFEYGDNLKYKVKINFPASIPPADTFDLNLEIFTLEQSEGKFCTRGFTIDKIIIGRIINQIKRVPLLK